MFTTKFLSKKNILYTGKVKKIKSLREAFIRVLSSVRFLMVHGLAIHGHTDENYNYRWLLELVAKDNSDLRFSLQCTKCKWLSHDIVNELGSFMVSELLQNLVTSLKKFQQLWMKLII